MKPEFWEPATLSEAAGLLAQHGEDARVIAGGTALVLMLRRGLVQPAALVSLGRVEGHRAIETIPDGLRIGALARLQEVARSPAARSFCPALAHSYAVVGNVRIRNQATVGGNLAEADYASDPPAMLLALDARVSVQGPGGRREIPAGDFFLGFYATALAPDEVVSGVFLPAPPEGARSVYLKYTARAAEDRPCVGVAAVAAFDEAGNCRDLRVAVGAAAETPRRLPALEAAAAGSPLSDALIAHISNGYAQEIEDVLEDQRGSAWYRRRMLNVFVRRALEEVRPGNR